MLSLSKKKLSNIDSQNLASCQLGNNKSNTHMGSLFHQQVLLGKEIGICMAQPVFPLSVCTTKTKV